MNKKEYEKRVPISKKNICIYRDSSKCSNCGACKGICSSKIGVYGHYDMKARSEPICINCGQCSLVCPNNSIREVSDYEKVISEIRKGKTVIAQIAPATRFLLGDEFGYDVGKNVIGKLITGLKKLGFSYVFDTTFGADLTVCEEATELLERLKNNSNLPLFTSCCPAWVSYANYFYPEYVKNLSTTKSPILMEGSIIKNYYAKEHNLSNVVVVAIVPCTAKKYEITKTDDVDYAITVREMVRWFNEVKIDFKKLSNSRFDDLTGTTSGIIFGASGGVTEAVVRYVYHKLTGKNPPKKFLEFSAVRGLEDVKEATIKIKGRDIKIAVVNGTGDVCHVIENLQNGVNYDIIEVMACDGGCIAGGGGPKRYKITNTTKNMRSSAIYKKDKNVKRKNSYENPKIKKIYSNFLGKPNSDKALEMLHVRGDSNE